MSHLHSVYDNDTHFKIDPVTRKIKNESGKVILMQNDHNSERFTFEIPRYVDGHDMSKCNKVEVHFINLKDDKTARNSDVYPVKDLQISPDSEDIVICSWLISQNATKYAGSLNFVLRYACLTDGVIDYQWYTDIHKGISVSESISNTVSVAIEYSDILEAWREELIPSGGGSAFDPTVYGLPVLYLTGDTSAMTKDNAVPLNYVYGELSGNAEVKWQGSSSLAYDKKNYTIKFDNAFEAAEGWGAQKKYCLKANWIDHSHARNVVSAKLWGETVKSRAIENTKLSALPNGGAVDGFPCIIMLNGDFHGLYTFNIPKDGWMYGMGNPDEEFQTEILPYKTYIDASVSVDGTYTPVNGIKGYFITTTSTLSGGVLM